MRLVRFGDYVFPEQTEFSHNFGNGVPRTVRLPGLDGGFDLYGDGLDTSEIGNVRTSFYISAPDLRAKVDEVMGLRAKGRALLYINPGTGSDELSLRYVLARVNNISIPEAVEELPHETLTVRINFQCAEPFWINRGTLGPLWGGGATWGGGVYWGGSAATVAASGTGTDISRDYAGSAPAAVRVTISPGTGDSCVDPVVERLVDGVVIDSVSYTGTLTDTDSLVIDSRAATVKVNGTSAYGDFDFTRGYWLRIMPGTNTFRVKFDGAGNAANVRLQYLERFY